MGKESKKEKAKKRAKNADDIAWDMFSQSGNIAHYLFYKELNKK